MTKRLTAFVAVLLTAFALAPPALAEVSPGDVSDDPEVVEQRERLERARSLLDAAAEDLTAAVEAYEHTRAHAHRLEDDLERSEQAEEAAAHKAEVAQEAFAAQVRASFAVRPEVLMTEALLASRDPKTALRRADLLRGSTSRSSAAFHRAEQTSGTVMADTAVHRDLSAAVAAAAADQRAAADELEAAVTRAHAAVGAAESDLDAAVADAMERERRRLAEERRRAEEERRRRAEEERRRAEEERLRAEGQRRGAAEGSVAMIDSGPAPAPNPEGRVCPVGEPHGFIDSWGFPRSGGRRHQGVDIFAARGTPVYAVADGTISRVGSNRLGGLVIDLVDGSGHRFYYAHLDTQRARQGQKVAAGDVIGTVGNTGNARGTPPHLHWEFRPGSGAPVNPFPLARSLCNPSHRGF